MATRVQLPILFANILLMVCIQSPSMCWAELLALIVDMATAIETQKYGWFWECPNGGMLHIWYPRGTNFSCIYLRYIFATFSRRPMQVPTCTTSGVYLEI